MTDTETSPLATYIRAVYSPATAERLLADYEDQVLAAAVRRVGLLPTANDGQLIGASRDQILNAIANTTQER